MNQLASSKLVDDRLANDYLQGKITRAEMRNILFYMGYQDLFWYRTRFWYKPWTWFMPEGEWRTPNAAA